MIEALGTNIPENDSKEPQILNKEPTIEIKVAKDCGTECEMILPSFIPSFKEDNPCRRCREGKSKSQKPLELKEPIK